ncbi:MAG: glycyl-radical enzyme activating protein [Chloroflexi bacterium]|nr:glycyl-radical enzyme activating protein [Chloroflexota bacterium]
MRAQAAGTDQGERTAALAPDGSGLPELPAAAAEMDAPTRARLEAVQGVVFDVQRYCLHDGPGLRTSVFFKGCPLQCAWCSNPESQRAEPELALFPALCIACGQFADACPEGWVDPAVSNGRRLAVYGPRAARCPARAVRWIGQVRAAGDLLAEVRRDTAFYEGVGGLTLTGGEPTLQQALAGALLRLARAEGLSTAMETCGYAPWPTLEGLLPYLDSLLFDLKHVDSRAHRTATDVGNECILQNLRWLAAAGAPLRVRVPLIPAFNTDDATLTAMADWIVSLPGLPPPVDLLPYHTWGQAKYAALGRPYPWAQQLPLDDEMVARSAAVFRRRGLQVSVGG